MSNLLKSELFKLRKDRIFWTLVFGLAISGGLYPILIFFDGSSFNAQAASVKEIYAYIALAGNNYIARLAPCILAGFFISSEYSIGTMKSIAASGNSRLRIYLAKLLVFSLGAVIISLVFPIFMTITGSLLSGFNEVPELSYIARTLGLTILYSLALASIMAVAAIIFTDNGKTIAFLFLFFILIDSILYALSQKFTLFEFIFNHSVFKLFLDITKFNVGSGELLNLLVVPIITYIIFALIGSIVFQKKEIK